MDVNVKYEDGDYIPVKNVETVGELKQKLRETEGTDFKFRDFDKYKLFQSGVELDDPTKLLEKLAQGGEGITLVKPEEVAKGNEKSRSIVSDKTRYIVVHDFSLLPKHKIYKLEANKLEKVKGSREGGPAYLLLGSQEIGLIKKVIRINDTERKVECISYDVKADGKIFIWKTDDQMETVQLHHKNNEEIENLEPLLNHKTYLERDLKYKTDRTPMSEILDLIERGEGGEEGGEEGAGERAGAGGEEAGGAEGAGDA